MKFIVPLFFITTLFCNPTKSLVEDFDQTPVFEKIFETIKVRTLLEFGLGYSTHYFLGECTKVISVDFISSDWGTDRIKQWLNLYRGSSNLVPVVYFSNFNGDFSWAPYKYQGSDALYRAHSYFTSTGQSYAAVDGSYQNEMRLFLSSLTKYNTIDVAFVKSEIVHQADIVQILFEKIPVIVACETQNPLLQVPANFEEIHISRATIWVKKTEELAPLIQVLKGSII